MENQKSILRDNPTKISEWLNRPGIKGTDREYKFNVKNAPEIIRKAIEEKQPITIIGDYDCDGVCASTILRMTLHEMGCKASIRLPKRFSEGYGMNMNMIDEIKEGLIITVDNGIGCLEEIEAAKKKGLTVIVTDHHLPVNENGLIILPVADCIINPHIEELTFQSGYDFFDYAGTGVVLKLAEKLIPDKPDTIDKMYALAAIATVADVMPMVGDNRNIYIRGARNISEDKMPKGLAALFQKNKIAYHDVPQELQAHHIITTDKIGFYLAPCINAASRMNDCGAEMALACLNATSNKAASRTADELINENNKRKQITMAESAEIEEQLMKNGEICPAVVYVPESKPGIIGLHAGRITEAYGVPSIVINGHGLCKGSGRAPAGVNLKELLDECKDCLETYGGHEGAAGLTIREENIQAFREALTRACRAHKIHPVERSAIIYDADISVNDVDATMHILNKMAPFGVDNPEPVICISDFVPENVLVLNKKHIKLCADKINVVQWGVAEGGIPEGYIADKKMKVVGTLNNNIWNNKVSTQMIASSVEEPDVPVLSEDYQDYGER